MTLIRLELQAVKALEIPDLSVVALKTCEVVVVRDTLCGEKEVVNGTVDWVSVLYVAGTVALVTADALDGTTVPFGEKLTVSTNVVVVAAGGASVKFSVGVEGVVWVKVVVSGKKIVV